MIKLRIKEYVDDNGKHYFRVQRKGLFWWREVDDKGYSLDLWNSIFETTSRVIAEAQIGSILCHHKSLVRKPV